MECAARRYGLRRPAPGTARICALALRADSLLQPAAYDSSRTDRMGAGTVWIRIDAGPGPRKAGVRSLLHQTHDIGARSADHVRNGKDDPSQAGRAVNCRLGLLAMHGRLLTQ